MDFVVAVLGGVVGAFATYMIQIWFVLASEDVALLNDQIFSIDRIEREAFAYWLAHGKGTHKDEIVFAAKLKAAVGVSEPFLEDAKRILVSRFAAYKALDSNLFDTATGGDFENPSRLASAEVAVAVSAICHDMRALLRTARRRRFWAR